MQILKAECGKSEIVMLLAEHSRCMTFCYMDENFFIGNPIGENYICGIKNSLDDSIKAVEELFENRKTLRKSDKELIMSALRSARQDIDSNAEFIVDSFNEQMDKTVTEAKGEIESFMQQQVHKLASEAISNKAKDGELPDNIKNPILLD